MGRKIVYKSRRDLDTMRQAGIMVSDVIQALAREIRPGVNTAYLDQFTWDMIRGLGGVPSFKNYRGFPASLCISINEEVVHGIPRRDRMLRGGDIVSLDVGVRLRGFHADAAVTVGVGTVSVTTQRLLNVTREALWEGIHEAREGNRLADVSRAIQNRVEAEGFSVVREMVGHGVGKNLHEEPQIPNYYEGDQPNPPLRSGMTLAIEPMVSAGRPEIEILGDQWTVVTQDRSLAAHFEHTVAIGSNGPEVLTASGTGDPIW